MFKRSGAFSDEPAVKSGQFDPRLESVRGLAALTVAAFHALMVYPTSGWARHCTVALREFFNGSYAVTIFFVLSGLVLGMGLQRQGRGTGRELCAYVIRRVFRIFPLLLLATAAILLFLLIARSYFGAHFWFSYVLEYRQPILNPSVFPDGRAVLHNLLLFSSSMNPVTWTLGVEMICSLLLPLAHYARLRLPSSGTWLLLAGAGFLALLSKWFLLLGWVKLEGSFNWATLGFFYLFYLGYLLPIIGPRCFARVKSSPIACGLLLVVGLGLPIVARRFNDTYGLGAAVSAWMLLGLLLYGCELKVFRCLEWPVVRFFGRISYSFYLLHDLVLLIIARLIAHYAFDGCLPGHPLLVNFILMVVSIGCAAILAAAAHRWIELPFIQFGKQLAGRLTSSRKSSAAPCPVDVPAGANVSV